MAEADIAPQVSSGKKSLLQLVPSPFELWASSHGYDIAPAVVPSDIRQYADRLTQDAYDAWNAGAQSVARMLMESTLETEALRERIKVWQNENRPVRGS